MRSTTLGAQSQSCGSICCLNEPLMAPSGGEWGFRESNWEDLDLVRNWKQFLDSPDRYLRHLT